MALDGNKRAMAQYKITPHLDKLTGNVDATGNPLDGEKLALLQNLQAIYAADTAYLTQNAVVNPASLAAPSGILVATTGAYASPGSTTAAGPLTGTGTIS